MTAGMLKDMELLQFPDERLRRVSEPVENFDKELKFLSKEMLKIMYQSNGIGLAAPQVNKTIRMIVLDVSEKRDQPMVFVNPRLEKVAGNIDSSEGCLSVPEIRTTIQRYKQIELFAQNIDGSAIRMEADDLLSICIQHEIDHLKGFVFLDRMKDFKQLSYEEEFEKFWLKKEDAP